MPEMMMPMQDQDPMQGRMIEIDQMSGMEEIPDLNELKQELKDRPAFDKMIPKDESERQEIVQALMDRFNAYADYRSRGPIEMIWDACYRAYRGYKPDDPHPYEFVYVIREIFRQIETLKPQLYDQFFGNWEQFLYEPEFPGDEDAARAATAIVRKQVKWMNIQPQLKRWLDNAVLYGTSHLLCYWKTFADQKLKIMPQYDVEEKETWWERKTEEFYKEGPYLEQYPPWRIFSHPNVEDPRESPAVFALDIVSPATLKTYVRQGWLNADAVEEAAEESGGGQKWFDKTHLTAQSDTWFSDYKNMDDAQMLLSVWTNDGWEYAILNGKHLVRGRRCDFGKAPILTLRNYPQQDELWGLPEPLQMLDDQNVLNDVMGMFCTGIHYSYNPMFKVKNTAAKLFKNSYFRPGGAIIVDGMQDVEPLPASPYVLQLPSVAGFIQQNMRVSTGITNELSGISGGTKTATEHVSLRDAASMRIKYKVIEFSPAFEEAYEMLHRLNGMYLDQDVAVELGGPDGKSAFRYIRPDVFAAPITVRVSLGNQMNVGDQAALKWMNVYARTMQDPRVDTTKILERLFTAMGEARPKEFLISEMRPMSDAMQENEYWKAWGSMEDPRLSDDDKVHYSVHQMLTQTDGFRAAREDWQERLLQHMQKHQERMNQKMQASGQAQQAGGPGQEGELGVGGGSPVPQTDMNTEAMFNNGDMGALSQGGVPQ